MDRMIALVEGADRQKTPNEIALQALLCALTLVFVLAVATLQPFAIYSGAHQGVIILVALVVALAPTTIGALLPAIGIAGMDRMVQHNVLAMSGRSRRGGRRPCRRCSWTRRAPSPSGTGWRRNSSLSVARTSRTWPGW